MIEKRLGERIKMERERIGLTQKELAIRASFNNYQTLLAIEKGQREIKLSELFSIAEALGLNVSYILEERREKAPKVLWRKREDTEARKKLENQLIQYCKSFQHLNELLSKDYERFEPYSKNDMDRDNFANDYEFAKNLALKYRENHLLGQYPARNLLLDLEKLNVLIFYYDLAGIGSAATTVGDFGAAILLNKNDVPWRTSFDIAHELFHIITWNLYSHDAIYDDERGKSDVEKYTDFFAAHLLMPEEVIKEEIATAEINSKVIKEDIIEIASKFGVSVQALTFHLQNMSIFKSEDMENLRTDNDITSSYSKFYSRFWEAGPRFEIPERYVLTAYKAYINDKISKMKLAEYLGKNLGEVDYFLKSEYNLDSTKEVNIEFSDIRC